MIWYADFSRGYVGKLDLATGAVKEWPSPSGPKSEPYGMVFTKGAVWYSESNAKPNTIVRFDPGTEKFQSWAIPGGGDIVRNMSVAPDGNPVMANSLINQVGRLKSSRRAFCRSLLETRRSTTGRLIVETGSGGRPFVVRVFRDVALPGPCILPCACIDRRRGDASDDGASAALPHSFWHWQRR